MHIDAALASLIGEDSRFEGGALMVDQLAVGAKGRVRTHITASSVVVEGVVSGNIEASRRVLLLSTARVLGDPRTPELIIQEGVVPEGRCTIGRAPAHAAGGTRGHIEAPYAAEAETP